MRSMACLGALLLLAISSGAGGAEMRRDEQGRWVNEAGGNPLGDSRLNLQADPAFNPRADPKFNPMGDPAFGPAGGARPLMGANP